MALFNKLYPWADWFTKSVFFLRRGKEYRCSTVSMAQQVRNAAAARGLRVKVVETAAGLRVVVVLKEGGVKCQVL